MMKERRPGCNALIGWWDMRKSTTHWGCWVISWLWLAPVVKWREPKLASWWHQEHCMVPSVAWICGLKRTGVTTLCIFHLNVWGHRVWRIASDPEKQDVGVWPLVFGPLWRPFPWLSFQYSFTILSQGEGGWASERFHLRSFHYVLRAAWGRRAARADEFMHACTHACTMQQTPVHITWTGTWTQVSVLYVWGIDALTSTLLVFIIARCR